MVNTILAKRINHIVAKGDNPVWPKGSKSRGFSNLTENFSLVAHYGFLGYRDKYNGNSVSGLSLSGNDLSFSLYYKF